MLDLTARVHFPSSLRAILTTPSIIKLGFGVRDTFLALATQYNDVELHRVLSKSSSTSMLIDLGQYARLKGAVSSPSASLQVLVGTSLKRSFSSPVPRPDWGSPSYIMQLHGCIEAVWQVYAALCKENSVGLHLTPLQATKHNLLVTVLHGQKPVAEGFLVFPHPTSIEVVNDEAGGLRRINITPSRSLVQLTKVLVPGAIHTLHSQSMQWIINHGNLIVSSTSTLRTRGSIPPHPTSAQSEAFSHPAPLAPQPTEEDIPPLILSINSNEPLPAADLDNGNLMDSDDEEQFADSADLSLDPGIGVPDGSMTGVSTETLVTRVLDDAFHFMDRQLRTLSKKHTAFRAFAHDFAEAIFIRDRHDETAVRAILEGNGISWEYAKRAKAKALNRRVRRYIPERNILVNRLKTLFDGYKNIICTESGGRKFFGKDALEMSEHLLDTAKQGFLSDPPGIPLYYIMGVDRDGLTLYRTIRGTNSVEGGVHMTIRRVFGSLQASPELAESILLNWILRRNKLVGILSQTIFH